ncbi:MAG: tetratricopeptide repeat protein [Alphaproteobacteria bacterium]|nr:tetratricopeptide repeat protein [Alphaproteobacteria bacterium]
MRADRYGLPLTTYSAAAQDDYVRACDLALTFYPGAVEAYDRAIAADPRFAPAYAGKAQVLMRQGDVAAARAALAAAKEVAADASEREASHIAFFDLVFSGRIEAAIDALYAHLTSWPRDALVVAVAANPNGVIGNSGHIGQKRRIAVLMDSLSGHYDEDPWFMSYHAMALSEDGRLAAARDKIERSLAANPKNAHGAHGFAHVCYESGELDSARAFLAPWLAGYPPNGFFYGHVSWHLSLCELHAGNWSQALRLYREAIALDRHSGGPQQRVSDGAAFLWRSELAGHPRDAAAWRALYEYAEDALPRPGNGLADLHVVLAQAVMGEDAAIETRARQMEELARQGRYPSGSYLPALARGFAAFDRGDFSTAIEALAALAGHNERIGGSRAQHDLIEFTLLRACIEANRLEEARHLLASRRPGASGVAVRGFAAVH